MSVLFSAPAASVSVIIPAYNAAIFVADAIRSVLRETDDVEIIVVDDGSIDATADVAAGCAPGVQVERLPTNLGVPTALNRGLALATGDVITILDADDLWQPGRFATQLDLLASTGAAAAWGRTRILFLEGDDSHTSPDWPDRHYPSLGSMFFRRETIERLGGFATAFRHAHDIDFLARATEAGLTFHRHDEAVLVWRRHANNMTNRVERDRDYLATAVRTALARRRGAVEPGTAPRRGAGAE